MKLTDICLNKPNESYRLYAAAFLNARIGFLVAVCLLALQAHAAWLDNAWINRQQVTISGTLATTETLTNFPVLVQITDQGNSIFHKAQNKGQDIVFTAADGITRLAHEIDSFRTGLTGSRMLNAWVSVPELLPGVETSLYMYYGNPWAVDQQDSGTVWAEYAGVWHLEEEEYGVNESLDLYRDSTVNGYHGKDYVSTNSSPGCVGNGAGMGGEDHIRLNRKLYTTNDFTITAWTKPDQLYRANIVSDNTYRFFSFYENGNLWGRSAQSNDVIGLTYSYASKLETNLWQHVAFRSTGEEGTIRVFYKNGAPLSSTSGRFLGPSLPADSWYLIGKYGSTSYFQGVLDEVRIADKALPIAWLDAEYRNASEPAAYVNFEPEEEGIVTVIPWPATYFAYRQEVGVTHGLTQVALTNFPMLIAITNSANPLFSVAAEDGYDIMFTDVDGVTPLAHEIENYSPSSPASFHAWVRLPTLHASMPTRVFMYYGRKGVVNHLNPTNVWSESYLGVWHLNEAVSHEQINHDSTVSAAHGVFMDPDNRGGGDAVGKIAGANEFQGQEAPYVLTPGVQCSSNGFTIAAWIYGDNTTTNLSGTYESGNRGASYSGINRGKYPIFSIFSSTAENKQRYVADYNTVVSNHRWYYFTGVCMPTQMLLYVDGEFKVNRTHDFIDAPLRAKYIGGSSGDCFVGTVDELRVSDVVRSTDWIKACYTTQNAPGAALIFMPPEYNTPKGTLMLVN